MSKNNFINGTILEFNLPLDLGYAYCKILDFRFIRAFDGVLVKVFDYIVKQPIDDIAILRDTDWLFGARRMPSLPGTKGKGAWRFKGVLVSKDDEVIPDFKYSIKYPLVNDDESTMGPWYAVKKVNQLSEKPYPYKCVKHLEDTVVSPRPAIEIRTAMEYCRTQNIDVIKYFDLNKPLNILIYRQMMNIPIYKTIPKEIRGKAIL